MTIPRIRTDSLGGSPLARRLIQGDAPADWYLARPTDAISWKARCEDVRRRKSDDWFASLLPAFEASGAARERLERVAGGRGVVVTTGQQPGLFGGPIYTWSKALSALELANALERETGVATAPVFWAATDDADFAEASSTWISLPGGAERLAMTTPPTDGIPMAERPLGDVSALLERLIAASGSAVEQGIIDRARRAYVPSQTIGGAYLAFLRSVLQPLGIAVLDASHPALMEAERPLLELALRRGSVVAESLAARGSELQGLGHAPQVADVAGLSLVFHRDEAGEKVRVPLADAERVLSRGTRERLSPNVLLRPLAEQAVLPTVGYVAGPGEIAYFAQVGAAATALGAPAPLVLPRWSCTIVEPHVDALLAKRGAAWSELAEPSRLEGRLAREHAPVAVMAALAEWRARVEGGATKFAAAVAAEAAILPPDVVEGTRRQMAWRAERLERRLVAALKRRDVEMRRDVATMAGALFPGGMRQERALNLVPILARHGLPVVDAMRAAARRHADALVGGAPLPVDPA